MADDATRTLAPSGRPVGAPRYFSNEALLVGMLLTGLQHSTVRITEVAAAVNLLPEDCLTDLGLRRATPTGPAVTLSQVDHAWNRLAEACNPSPTRDGKRLPKDPEGNPLPGVRRVRVADRKFLRPELSDADARHAPTRAVSNRGGPRPLTDAEAASRRRLLQEITDRLLAATVPEGVVYDAVMVDWTDHETAARTATSKRTSADPDAAWGRRRAKRTLPAGFRRGRSVRPTRPAEQAARLDPTGFETDKDELFYGYNLHVAVGVAAVDAPPLPELALSMRVTAANDMAAVAPVAVDMLDAVLAGGQPVRAMGVDLGYSMRRPETLHLPVSERGVHLVYGFAAADHGRHGTYKDAVLINGVPFCPFTPAVRTDERGEEIAVMPPSDLASREEWRAYWVDRDRLDRYQFRPHGRPNPGLHQRFQCPARAGKVRCPFVATSLSLPHRADIPDIGVLMAGDQDPLACCGKTITLERSVGLGRRQHPIHASREHVKSFNRRSAVERYNSAIKQFGIDGPDVRVLGLAKRTLTLAVAATVTNLRLLRTWEARTDEPAAPTSQQRSPRAA